MTFSLQAGLLMAPSFFFEETGGAVASTDIFNKSKRTGPGLQVTTGFKKQRKK